MRKLLSAVCLSTLALFSRPSAALEMGYTFENPFDGSKTSAEALYLKGEIVPGDYANLLEMITNDQERFWNSMGFILSSPGGDVQEALKIAEFVKGTYSSVFVGPHSGSCVSSCFFIYAAAARRVGGAYRLLGVHRPYISSRSMKSLTPNQAETLQNSALRQARRYLENLQVPTSIIDKMFQNASTEIWWLTPSEIEDQVGMRPPWYEQFLISRCGSDKATERAYFRTNDKRFRDQLVKVNMCGRELSRPDAQAFFYAALLEAKNGARLKQTK